VFFAAVFCGLNLAGFLPTNGGTMHTRPTEAGIMEQARQAMVARIARDGRRHDESPCPAAIPKDEARRLRSLRCCHLPAEPKPRRPSPRPSGAYIPELAARLEDDLNLTDGARRCARKLAEYIYRRNREGRAAEITVTYLMAALGKCRRTVQHYLRQLEREGYITVEVVSARAGLFIELLAPLFPRHHRQKWPGKLIDSDVQQKSQNNRSRYKTLQIPRELWAARCCEGIWRAWQKIQTPLPALPITL
jgi:hypothetical protein